MDRAMVFTGAVPLATDFLFPQRAAMVGLAKLSEAVLGQQPVVDGLTVTPASPAGLSVVVTPGQIYSLAALDSLAYGEMPADPGHQIVKQGVQIDPVTLAIAPPGTAGYSQWFLVQCAFQESETGAAVLPYYNSANPSQAWSGPANSGQQQYTRRLGIVTLQIKPGTPEPTGSHQQPQPDPGWTGLAWVTVTAGATTIQGAAIQPYTASNRIPIKLPQLIKAVGAAHTLVTTTPRKLRAEEAGLVVVDTTNIAVGGKLLLPPANAVPGVPLRFKIIGRQITPPVNASLNYVNVGVGVPTDTIDLDGIYVGAGDAVELTSDGFSRWYWTGGLATHHVSSYLFSNLTLPDGINTSIPWPDLGLYAPVWRAAGLPTWFRIPFSGRYSVTAGLAFLSNGAPASIRSTRSARVYVNGFMLGAYAAYSNQGVPGGEGHVVLMRSAALGFRAGDVVEVVAYQNSGLPMNLAMTDTWVQIKAELG